MLYYNFQKMMLTMRTHQHPPKPVTEMQQALTILSTFHAIALSTVTVYILRYVQNSRKQQPHLTGPLTVTERNTAMKHWISSAQLSGFPAESTYFLKKQPVCPTLVKQLRLFLDKDKFMRCGGRIHNAPVSDSTKFPLLLPPKYPLTTMII